jgi:hypothetical protein
MKTMSNNLRLSFNESNQPELSFTLSCSRQEAQRTTTDLKQILQSGNTLTLEVKKYSPKRSLNANNYLWLICDKIAKKMNDGRTLKEDIYREAIRKVGVWEIVPIKESEVESRIRKWNNIGEGWFAEVLQDSKLHGYKNVRAYFGSSSYEVPEMSILIDYIVEEAKEQGIETLTPNEIAELKSKWDEK